MNDQKDEGPVFDSGWCRCCGVMRKCRVLNVEYESFEQNETYCDMLMDCFGLLLAHLDGEPTERLICAMCIKRLQEAFKFRQQILHCEEIFIQMKMDEANAEIEPEEAPEAQEKMIEFELEVKVESDYSEPSLGRNSIADNASDQGNEKLDNAYNSNDDVPLQNMISNSFSEQKRKLLKPRNKDEVAVTTHVRRNLDKGITSVMSKYPKVPSRKLLKPQSVNGATKYRSRVIFPKMPQKFSKESDCETITKVLCNDRVKEKMAHIMNASTLLQHSNAVPFKSRTRLGFPCYYCRKIFERLDKLRDHQTSQHRKAELKKIVSGYRVECLVVYADVTDLKCTICNESIPKLNDLKSHLIKTHNKTIYSEYNDRVVPFKLSPNNVYECQMCGFNFETFGSIERHMNVHFRNYVCKECGTGFVTKYRLKVHTKSMHITGSFPCDVCKKVFATQQKQKNHVDTVHKLIKRFKCPKCQERFSEYFRRQKHLVEVHGVAPLQYKCNVCDKIFYIRSTLSRHMKRDHLEERSLQCEHCMYKCFTNYELRVHMIKHSGERVHECSVCKKSYARKKTLREHMRIHDNDRRFACDECGQTFVQKCSLKVHIKSHHFE